jgi:4-O-beta-D-mannosyl-D-glucose phosphorylase
VITFTDRLNALTNEQNELLSRPNHPILPGNGCFVRYQQPIITPAHTPLNWRYDLNPATNPHLMERMGINATFNPGAIELNGKHLLVVRVEGNDRKSFFAVAESANGIDGFRFWPQPCVIPETEQPDTNVYDMRLVKHEDGHIYGLFCTERKDPDAASGDESAALAQCGIVRTSDLKTWQRLPDLKTQSAQQRNVVLHPEFVNGKYMLYTRPQDSFIEAGKGGGIGCGFTDSMDNAVIEDEIILDPKCYHTIKESKNGQGPAPIKTRAGWLHIAHGVRNTAAGLRYVLYAFMTALEDPLRVTYRPGGYFLAPEGEERVGDVSNVVFCNGVISREDGQILIYYASSDTRCHVLSTNEERLVDWVINTPEDALTSANSVQQRLALIQQNRTFQI